MNIFFYTILNTYLITTILSVFIKFSSHELLNLIKRKLYKTIENSKFSEKIKKSTKDDIKKSIIINKQIFKLDVSDFIPIFNILYLYEDIKNIKEACSIYLCIIKLNKGMAN